MKCDELKAMSAVDAYEEYENNILDESKHHYYNKKDVDEAIAELKEKYEKLAKDHDHAIQACCDADKEIAELKDKLRAANEQVENIINSASSIMLAQDKTVDYKCVELRRQKRKRYLRRMWKWRTRWLEIADKLKEKKE